MIKKTVLVNIVTLLLVSQVFSQAPGYQGKRLSVNYNIFINPALSNPTMSDFESENYSGSGSYYGIERIFTFNKRNRISFDYVLSRRNSIGIGFEFFKTRFKLNENDLFSSRYEYTRQYLARINGYIGNISTSIVNAHYTFYSNESIAPLGKYTQIDLGIIRYSAEFDDKKFSESFRDEFANYSPYNAWYFGLNYGRKRIFFDRLILDYGVQGCFIPGSYLYKNWFDFNELSFTERNYLKETSKNRLFHHMLINIHFGIGFLIF
ncbi:MAG: hypothetical protein K9J13_17390 [Saprospiraceae bacterium]|nr:hypothetical protein [Saprospiraceae bacterium]